MSFTSGFALACSDDDVAGGAGAAAARGGVAGAAAGFSVAAGVSAGGVAELGSCGVGLTGGTTLLLSPPGAFQPTISKCGRRFGPNFVFIGFSSGLTIGITRSPRIARTVKTCSRSWS